jgi:hypothetical protein
MNKKTLISCGLVLLAGLLKADNMNKPISKLVTTEAGKTYLEVDGEPILYNSVQAWLPEDGNYELNMRKAHEVGYKVFTFWFPWRMIEPTQGDYDWEPLGAMIGLAEKYDMRLDIVWGGTNFCGGLDPRFPPDFILNNPEFHAKDEYGRVIRNKQAEQGLRQLANYANPELLEIESATIESMMNYLAKRDTTHRVIFFQIQNEPNHPSQTWAQQGKEAVLPYINALGKVIKESAYPMATRVNLAGNSYEPAIDDLEYIDCQGLGPYTESLEAIRRMASADTTMPHIAENAAYENSTTLMAETFALGGFYNIYRLDYDYVWSKPGVYGDAWIYLHQTYDIQFMNEGLNKMARQVTVAPAANMLSFNTDGDMPDGNYEAFKTLNGIEVGFKPIGLWRQQGVGFALAKEDAVYVIADNHCHYLFKEKVAIDSGHFNQAGEWVTDYQPNLTKNKKGQYEFYYYPGECIRIRKN